MQSRLGSFTESVVNVFVGYWLAVLVQLVVLPDLNAAEHLGIAAIFTAVSIVRSYAMRRIFNAYTMWRIR